MSVEQFHNIPAQTTVADGGDGIDASQLTVGVADGSVFSASGIFRVEIGTELLKVASRSGNTLTVVRADGGTTAATHAEGATVKQVLSKEGLERLGTVIHPSDIFANLPAASAANEGHVYRPTDGFYTLRSDGSVWTPWGPVFPFTAPIDANYAWINQGGATLDTSGGGIYLEAPTDAGVANLRVRKKSAPATPYTITAAFMPFMPQTAGVFPGLGLCFRESGTSKIIAAGWNSENDPDTKPIIRAGLSKWTNATTFSANYGTQAFQDAHVYIWGPVVYFQIGNDGTNLTFKYGNDGKRWALVKSAAKNDFFTTGPDEVGFYSLANNSVTPVGIFLLSWKEA
jgi:hypothetical protein